MAVVNVLGLITMMRIMKIVFTVTLAIGIKMVELETKGPYSYAWYEMVKKW